MKCIWNCQKAILRWFYNYGHFLGKHPLFFLIIPLVVCGCLGVGLGYLKTKDDIEYLYAPSESRSIDEREIVSQTLREHEDSYTPFSQNQLGRETRVIFRSKKDKAVFTDEVLDELEAFTNAILTMVVTVDRSNFTYTKVCQTRNGRCVNSGGFIFEPTFRNALKAGKVTYPIWAGLEGVDLSNVFANVNINDSKTLVSAGSFKITLPLNWEAEHWEAEFLKVVREYNFTTVNVAYAVSYSLEKELQKSTQSDILFMSLTFTLMITFASIVSSGGDCVSTRALLANAGVVAVAFGIMGAIGLVSLCGVEFVSLVGMMPFLTLGIGVDDMFLLMGSWSETLSITGLTIPERIGTVFKKAGIGITITSVTDCLAFIIGASSTFRSVRFFCIYTGVGVILCYICNACVFGACLTLHGRRVYASRHALICRKVEKPRKVLRKDGRSFCHAWWCGGKVPTSPDDEQSIFEKGPRRALVRFLLWNPVRFLILLFFAGYLGVSIWGCTKLQQGLELKNLAPGSSYYYTFQTWEDEDFGLRLPISFVTTKTKNYTDIQTLKDVQDVLAKAQEDPLIVQNLSICWLTTLNETGFYNTTSEQAFVSSVREFLQHQPLFKNDIAFSPDNKSIIASRCHVYSKKVVESSKQAELMVNMRKIADSSSADVFAFHPMFVIIEQYVAILGNTLQTVGVTIAVMFVATCIFLPHPLMVILVIAQVVMIVVGIFGFMAHWDLTLSSITMIHIIMSVGFSVDFCAHVCTAYMVSEETARRERARDSIIHASSPIFNGGISTFLGVVVLIFSESYIFQSFFKIMLLVIGFGVLHAVFLVPVVLSFIGPSAHINLEGKVSPSPSEDNAIQNGHINHSSSRTENGTVKDSSGDINLIAVKMLSYPNMPPYYKKGVNNKAFCDGQALEDDTNKNDVDNIKGKDQVLSDKEVVYNDISGVNVKSQDKFINANQDNYNIKTGKNENHAISMMDGSDDKLTNNNQDSTNNCTIKSDKNGVTTIIISPQPNDNLKNSDQDIFENSNL